MADDDLLVRVGLTEKEYIAALKRLEAQSLKSAKQAETAWKKQNAGFVRGASRANQAASGFSNGGLRMMGQQLSQVAQQGAATGDWLRAFSIQAADVGLAFGGIGIAAGIALTVLGPMVGDLISVGDSAEDVERKIKALSAAMQRLDDARGQSGRGRSSLVDEYGGMADRARELIAIEREIAEIRAREAQQAATRAVGQGLGLGGVLGLEPDEIRLAESTLEALRTEIDRLQTSGGKLSDEAFLRLNNRIVELQERAGNLRSVTKNFDDLAAMLGITEREAREVAARFAEIEQTDDARARADAMIALARYISKVSGNLGDADEEGQALYDQLLAAVRAALELAAVDIASNMAEGTKEAGKMLSNLAAAAALFNQISAAESKTYSGRGQDPRLFMGDGRGTRGHYTANVDYIPIDDIIERYNKQLASGKGGGGTSKASKDARDYARAAERYIEQARTAVEAYNAELALLEELNEKGFFKEHPEAYAHAVAQLNDEFVRLEYDRLIDGIDSVSDAMAQAIVNGENMGEALGNVFRQIAADLLSSGIRQMIMGLFGFGGGGTGNGFGKFIGSLLSFDGGGYTGSGPRAGGIDGKGGFLSVMHPNETVIDHSRGGGGGGEITVRVDVDGSGNIIPVIERVSGPIAAHTTAAGLATAQRGLGPSVRGLQARGTS
ncbi:hypothetical protein KZZ07_21240 [Mameliella sp. CS4]|uniref:hypothetical protein n=1 Tax=Mameliella sp. CS4 TaxID=2862329 RepID=UPI001C5DEF1B|nr:hypothetical protein [Mameliella sp. CS4]MBW4985073.1 hypothetical protein [Mameliella sp. CS4]